MTVPPNQTFLRSHGATTLKPAERGWWLAYKISSFEHGEKSAGTMNISLPIVIVNRSDALRVCKLILKDHKRPRALVGSADALRTTECAWPQAISSTMPALKNSRHELFAQGIASGLSASESYRRASSGKSGKNADKQVIKCARSPAWRRVLLN